MSVIFRFIVTNPGVLGDTGQPEDEGVLLLRGDGGQLPLVRAGARQAGGIPAHLENEDQNKLRNKG